MGVLRGFADHVRGQPLVHRLVPMAAALRLIEARARVAWRDPIVRFQAEAHMRYLVGRSERAGEIAELARLYVFEYFRLNETTYRPWRYTSDPVDGIDRLRDAVAQGRGVVLHALHHGQFGGAVASLGRYGFQPRCPAHPGLIGGLTADQKAFVRLVEYRGAVLLPAAGSFQTLLEVCRSGGIVGITGDVRGKTRTTFLGREVMCARGPSQLSRESGALVVPMTVKPEGSGQRVVLGDPIDPHDFPDAPALQREILSRHEESVLAWPQAMKSPLISWLPVPEDAHELGLDDPRLAKLRI